MPGGDGTGPRGIGPMTGRAAGVCKGYGAPGYANPMAGRGRDRGFGRGRGFGWAPPGAWAWGAPPYGVPYAPEPMPMPEPTPEQEATALKAHAQHLDGVLADIRKRLDELEAARAGGER